MQRLKGFIRTSINKIIRLTKLNLKDRWIEINFILKRFSGKKSGKYRPIDSKILKAYNKYRGNRKKKLLCHAPFKSLRMQPDGRVISCCINRLYTLGKYPEDSITEIWRGEKLNKLRSHIINNDLSIGCSGCYEAMMQKNFPSVPAIFYDEYSIEKNNPVILEFELENTCNLECIMCCGGLSSNVREKREKRPSLPKIYDESFLNELDSILPKIKRAHFVGGEPFLIKIYYSIWEKIITVNPGCLIIVQTNGTILNDRIKELLEKGNFRISISLDSINKDTYEKIRLNADFETTISNVQYFAEHARSKGNNISLTICPMRLNITELPEFVAFCNKINSLVSFNPVYYPNNLAIWNLSSIELKRIYEFLSAQIFTGSGYFASENNKRYNGILKQIKSWHKESLVRESNLSIFSEDENKKLEEMFLNKLKNYILLDTINYNQSDYERVVHILKDHLRNIESNKLKHGILTSFMNLPVETVYEVLNDTSHESFISSALYDFVLKPFENEDNFVYKYD